MRNTHLSVCLCELILKLAISVNPKANAFVKYLFDYVFVYD